MLAEHGYLPPSHGGLVLLTWTVKLFRESFADYCHMRLAQGSDTNANYQTICQETPSANIEVCRSRNAKTMTPAKRVIGSRERIYFHKIS
jgi:hypothetical protein